MTAPAAPPEPGANPLDMPEVRRALMAAMLDVVDAWPSPEDDEERAEHAMTGAILAVLAPHVAAARGAAFRAGVEASASVSTLPSGTFKPALKAKGLDDDMADLLGETLDTALGLVAETIRAIPVPAEFAAPESADNDAADKLHEIKHAIADYHHALDTRQHGDLAADRALRAIQQAIGRPWVQGAERRRRESP